jgi:hypothetical protein
MENTDSDNSEKYRKLKKYIGIDNNSENISLKSISNRENKSSPSDDLRLTIIDKPPKKKERKVIRIGGNLKNHDKIIEVCQKAKIETRINGKIKNYTQLLESCHKRKRDVIKDYLMSMTQYATKKGYSKLAGTYIIESMSDTMISKLRAIDKLIELVQNEINPNKNNNILSLLNVKKKVSTTSSVDVNDIVLEEYSDGNSC